MLSSVINFKDLSLIGHRVLSLFKLKSYLSLSALLALFLSFSLIGCGGKDSNNGGSEPPTFSVSFYDENLTLLEKSDNLPNGHEVDFTSNGSAYNVSDWYLANSSTPAPTPYALTSNINFYAIPNVIGITTQEELADINTDIGTLAGKYILLNDIPLDDTKAGVDAAYGWIPIGDNSNSFTGIFNGNGNTILNLWINRTAAVNIGLFGYIKNAQIKNLTVETAEGKEVKGQYYVGGIAGHVREYSSITNSYAVGNVNGNSYVGGIAGYVYASSSISNSYSAGNVHGTGDNVGGIAGFVWGLSSITNSYTTGNVNGVDYVGGIAGYVRDSSSITNSYTTGTINGTNYVGGITGESIGTITNNAAINPSVTGSTNVNRVAGYVGGSTVTNNFALDDMDGSFSGGDAGTFKSEAELQQEATYSDDVSSGGLGWKFGNDADNPWKIDEGNGYPYLYWQEL